MSVFWICLLVYLSLSAGAGIGWMAHARLSQRSENEPSQFEHEWRER
jgi:hypothetical protein